jgi:hypothetical protein
MATISFTIKDAATVTRIQEAFIAIYPIPQVLVDEEVPEGAKENQYTDVVWIKMKISDYVKSVVQRAENKAARNAISIDVPEDAIL